MDATLLNGRDVKDLGVVFSYQVHGKNRPERDCVFPNAVIKSLAFGNMSTIYRAGRDKDGNINYDSEDPKNTWLLQSGSTTGAGRLAPTDWL